MPDTLRPLAGLFDHEQIAAMTLVLDELCEEVPKRRLLPHLPQDELRPAIGKLIIEIQSGSSIRPETLKEMVMTAIETT